MYQDEIGLRMKENYENISKFKLVRRMPVMIRLDGRAFHTFTKGFQKPFDGILIAVMQDTMKYLCENIQNCVLGYTQSDEITLVLVDYNTFYTEAWFGYEIQKMCSISASMATMAFNKYFTRAVKNYELEYKTSLVPQCVELQEKHQKYLETLKNAAEKGAMFDARVFNIPKEEVTNCIYWRQLDATRNSIQMVGQAHFSHNELHGKSCNQIQDMLHEEKGINWNDYPTYLKRGSCCIKKHYFSTEDPTKLRSKWEVDLNIPEFKGEGREYIDKLIFVGD